MSSLKLKVDELLSKLEKKASAEEIFAQNLAQSSQPAEQQVVPTEQDLQTVKEWDEKGRILARAFFDELQKLLMASSSEVPGVAPDTASGTVLTNNEPVRNIISKIINNLQNK